MPVGEGIVADHALHLDAVIGEEGVAQPQRTVAVSPRSSAQISRVAEPGVVVHGDRRSRTHACGAGPVFIAAMDTLSTPRWNRPQFLDVDMDHVTGPLVLVAADHLVGGGTV